MTSDVLMMMRNLTGKRSFTSAAMAAALMLGACSQSNDLLGTSELASNNQPQALKPGEAPQTELQKATVYWGKEYQKQPSKLENAMNYARNLKALGERQKALNVFQQASTLHSGDPDLASEYGRLALELDQVGVAERLLAVADNPAKPDWRVVSARGTVFAKKGLYSEAIPFYERALQMSANQPSVLNNLAMAYAMKGDAKTAESYLRQANAAPGSTKRVQQNLALVLGLQGRYAEAKSTAVASASADTDMIRSIVKLDPQSSPQTPLQPALASAQDPAVAFKPATVETVAQQQGSNDGWAANVAVNGTTKAP